MSSLVCSIENGIATLVLNKPPQNRISLELADDLGEALSVVGASGARALLLRAEGENFCVGGDFVSWPDMSQHELRSMFERFMDAFNRFERLPIPTVAAVQGGCFGGGLELAIRADVIIASENARFGHLEPSLGLVTMLGGVYRLAQRVGRAKAMAMVLTSAQCSSKEMERDGVVHRIVPDADLVQEVTAFVTKLAAGATKAHAAHKALLRVAATGGIASADEAMLDIGLPLFETEDVKSALPAAVALMNAGKPRTPFPFEGR